jgi:hypothetical protein
MRRAEFALLIATVLLTASWTSAQSRNAATWYRKAVDRLAPYEDRPLFSQRDMELIDEYRTNASVAPSDEVRALLARANGVMQQVRRGAREYYADYDLDYSQGFNLTLPHLQPLRDIGRIMQADALLRLHDGDAAGAVDRLSTIVGLSSQLRGDRTLISSLVAAHIYGLADDAMQSGLDRESFSPAQSAALLAATQRLEPVDPFGMGESLGMEGSLVAEWIAADFADPAAREAYVDEGGWLTGDAENDQALIDLTEAEFLEEVDRYEGMMLLVAEAISLDDREAARRRLDEIEADVGAGEHGLMARLFMPSASHVLDRMKHSEELVAKRVEVLEGIAAGAVSPEAQANAAVYYDRGIRGLRRLDIDRVDAIINGIPPDDPDLALELQMTSVGVQAVIELFRTGASKTRCDFAFLRERKGERLCHAYVAGMRDVLAVARADARRLMSEGRIDAATEVLEVCFRVIAHMGRDEVIMSSLVAHDAFLETARVERDLAGAPGFTEEHRARLLDAARSISRKDPFGHLRGVAGTRKRLISIMRPVPPGGGDRAAARAALAGAINAQGGNRLLYLVAVQETVDRKGDDPAAPAPKVDPLSRVAGLVDEASLEKVRAQAVAVHARIIAGDHAPVLAEAVVIADADERLASARKDVRGVLIRLRPPRAGAAPAPPGEQ